MIKLSQLVLSGALVFGTSSCTINGFRPIIKKIAPGTIYENFGGPGYEKPTDNSAHNLELSTIKRDVYDHFKNISVSQPPPKIERIFGGVKPRDPLDFIFQNHDAAYFLSDTLWGCHAADRALVRVTTEMYPTLDPKAKKYVKNVCNKFFTGSFLRYLAGKPFYDVKWSCNAPRFWKSDEQVYQFIKTGVISTVEKK